MTDYWRASAASELHTNRVNGNLRYIYDLLHESA